MTLYLWDTKGKYQQHKVTWNDKDSNFIIPNMHDRSRWIFIEKIDFIYLEHPEELL